MDTSETYIKMNRYNINQLLTNGVEAKVFNEITRRIQEESSKKLIDEHWLREARKWSVLGHQVVGAEVF